MLLVLVLFTWLIGGVLAVAESARRQRWAAGLRSISGQRSALPGLRSAPASRMTRTDLSDLDVFQHIAGHIVVFDILLLALILMLACLLLFADRRPRPASVFGRMPVLSLGVGLVALVAAFW